MSQIRIKSISQVGQYLNTSSKVMEVLATTIPELQSTVGTAASAWRDSSVERAKEDVDSSIKRLNSACSQLQPILDNLKKQYEWAIDVASVQ